MRKYENLKKKKDIIMGSINEEVCNLEKISTESQRVAQIANNVSEVVNDIDKQFRRATKLNNIDITFLMLATALQCVRQYVFSNDKFRLDKASDGDKLVKDPLKKVTPKEWHDILFGSVPYDAVGQTDGFKDLNINSGISGSTHRYRALGHDPILGWIIGPINILSDSLTKNDFVTTYRVTSNKLDGIYEGGTIGAIGVAYEQVQANKWNLPAAVMKQAIHFGADSFTRQGLPIPGISSLNENLARDMLSKYHIDTYSVMRGVTLSILINSIIECIHMLFYNEKRDISVDLYKVRTKKIMMYSNVIASTSNIIYTAISKDLTKLDLGGILVTLYRITTDLKFISEIKKEFLEEEFYKIVMGENINSIIGGQS